MSAKTDSLRVVQLPSQDDMRRRLERLRIKGHVRDMIPLFQEYAFKRMLPNGVTMMIRMVFLRYTRGDAELSLKLYRVASFGIVDALVDDKKVREKVKSQLRAFSRLEKMGEDRFFRNCN